MFGRTSGVAMSTNSGGNSAPIIIKRVSGDGEGGHHGGAWKVAYADFVTAMMAFFLLMWLLNATTEKQRQGLAEYFNPTIVQQMSGGSDGLRSGKADAEATAEAKSQPGAETALEQLAQALQDELAGIGAESMVKANLLRHVVTRVTDEGVVIELSDLTGAPLFHDETARPRPETVQLAEILSTVLGRVRNQLAINGHVHSFPEMMINSPVWTLSDARAHAVRELMVGAGLPDRRVQRVTGFADRENRSANPMDPANNRIEVILLR